jgi:hypothetical protein
MLTRSHARLPSVTKWESWRGEEGALPHRDAVVAHVRVGDHLATIVARLQRAADELVEAELFGARDLRNPIQRRYDGDRATPLATSSAAIGWMSAGGSLTACRRWPGQRCRP